MPPGDLIPYEGNPRRNAKTVEALKKSLKRFEWQQPIVVDENRVVVIGHARLLAALAMGEELVPVHVAGDLSPEQARGLRVMDNRSREFAEWDIEALKKELGYLDPELREATGFVDGDPLLTGWTPPDLTALPGREKTRVLVFTLKEWPAVERAIKKARKMDPAMKPGRAIELICADALGGE